MRKSLLSFGLGVLALELVSVMGAAQIVPHPAPSPPPSLKSVPVPEPEHLGEFVKDRSAAIALGKALFWDIQVGGDGRTACASCHFQAGADTRVVNQLNPGANGLFDVGGPNHRFSAHEFPFHQPSDPENRKSAIVRSRDDVAGSQGVHASDFLDVHLGVARDDQDFGATDPLGFQVGGLNVRRVTGRNTPPAVNAVFNVRNFWDGRASRRFNGRNPFGDSDPDARVLRVNDLGEPELVRVSIDRASLASQAVGPPLSDVEMSAAGRTWLKLGKKMLALQPLGLQEVHPQDSVLGPLAISGGTGLATTYADMIRAAFDERWWDSPVVVDADLAPIPGVSAPADGSALPTDQYTVMEANFSLLWGLAILCYESTLVSDDAPYDRYAEGDAGALSPQQQLGLRLFLSGNTGSCASCHAGSEFTGASFSARLDPTTPDGMIERMVMGDGRMGVYDGGFYNIGVRPTHEDIGLGASDPFGRPLSLAQQEQNEPGSVEDAKIGPVRAGERIVKDGAFKTPSLRNIELTGPYFHNGSVASLRDVVMFYARGGNFREQNIDDLDPDIHTQRRLIGSPMRVLALTNFLRALTDERVRWQKAPFDHPELPLPAGATGNELSVLEDLGFPGQGEDAMTTLEATGAGGSSSPLRSFLELPVFDPTPIPAPNPATSNLAIFATDTVLVESGLESEGDVWSNGVVLIRPDDGAFRHHGDLIAGDAIRVEADSMRLKGSMLSAGALDVPLDASVEEGVLGDHIEHYAPLVMPELPSVQVGTQLVKVDKGQTRILSPGSYGAISVGKDATLVLEDGTYVCKTLSIGPNAVLQYDAGGSPDPVTGPDDDFDLPGPEKVTLHVIGDVQLTAGSSVTSGASERSNRFRLVLHQPKKGVFLNSGSVFEGSIVAPGAKVVLAPRTGFIGTVFARYVDVGSKSAFQSHRHGEVLPLATLPGAKVRTPGPGDGASTLLAESETPGAVRFALSQNLPNPVRRSTAIRFALPERREVRLEVFDVGGRLVRTLANGVLPAGAHTLSWNGTNERGRRVASGVYLYRLVSGRDVAQRKMIVLD